jgi:undecaprenyl-diphosphatase
MTLWLALLLGLVQGLTEFIPVSSSGHLAILQIFLSGVADHHFLAIINFGTLFALLIYFRRDLLTILKSFRPNRRFAPSAGTGLSDNGNRRLGLHLLITAVPAGLAGFLLGDLIATSTFMNSLMVIALALAAVGLLMIFADRLAPRPKLDLARLTSFQALQIGLAQILALQPGVSRSGSTILAGRFLGLPNDQAARYSFLAGIPLMAGVCLYTLISSSNRAYLVANWPALLLGNLVAFLAGFLVIKYLLRYLKRPRSLRLFGFYRLGLAAVCVVIALARLP